MSPEQFRLFLRSTGIIILLIIITQSTILLPENLSPHTSSGLSPILVIQQQSFSSSNPFITTFPLRDASRGATPFVLYPLNDRTVWVATTRAEFPLYSQIVNFTLGSPTTTVANVTNAIIGSLNVDNAGRVWFTYNDTLAYYDPALKATKAAIDYPGGAPQYTVLDRQGRIWVTLAGSSQIAMVDPLNPQDTPRFNIPTANSIPQGITLAPDGTVWFAEAGSTKLAEFNPDSCAGGSCTINEHSPPFELSAPVQVAVDNNDIVWFTDHGSNEFGSFNRQTGEWEKFPVGYCEGDCSIALPNAIAVDKEGRIWFSEHVSGRIAHYDAERGVLTEYIIPSNGTQTDYPVWAWWMRPGNNNLIWFTSLGLGMIGYVNASLPANLSMTADKEAMIPQGGTGKIRVTVNQYTSQVSLATSSPYKDSRKGAAVYSSDVKIVPSREKSSTFTLTATAGWNSAVGLHYITVSASDGLVTVNLPIKVIVTLPLLPYTTVAVVLVIPVTTLLVRIRSQRTRRVVHHGTESLPSGTLEKSNIRP